MVENTKRPTAETYRRETPVKRHPSFTLGLIGQLLDALVLVLLAWAFSILFEWIGLSFIWTEEGVMHSERMLSTELGYLNEDFKQSLLGVSPMEFAVKSATQIDYWLFEATYFRDILAWAMTAPEEAGRFRTGLARIVSLTHDYLAAAMNITQLFGVRLAIALLSMPAFLLVGAAALIDGLVRRDIRRYSGANESSFIYHNVKPWVRPAFTGAWFIYLGLPVAMHPNLIFIPASLLFGLAIYISSAMFKKFL